MISVLDHGFVRLVDHMGSDLSIVRNARVSHDAAWRTGIDAGKDEKLINYLYHNKHNTPFESVVFTFEVKAPIFVLRQWHRHRTWSYNEVSARYTELPEEYFVPDRKTITGHSTHNKQARGGSPILAANHAAEVIAQQNAASFYQYQHLLEIGVPRELARTVLPLGTYSHMFAKVDLHNLFHFLRLRADAHAQYEIRVYAEAICAMVADWVPAAYGAFEDYRLGGATLSGRALDCMRRMLKGEEVTQETSGMSKGEWREFMGVVGE